jgi:excinuclease ABC subunit C
MKDQSGRVLYIGKAKRLDHRVRSYLVPAPALHPRTGRMMRLVADLDFIVTESEAEALVLESTLVREHRPHFNIRLKDDKTFPWVKLSVKEEVPRLSITRKLVDDGSRYFGPFTDVGALRRTMRVLRRVFPLRTCADLEHYRRIDRPCLNYYIRRCVGPCYSKAQVSPETYGELVEGMALFLSGNQDEVRRRLEGDMGRAAEARDYERAALIRDQLTRVDTVQQVQRMAGPGEREADALGVARQGNDACVAMLQLRGGRVVGREMRFLRGTRGSESADILEDFIAQYYLRQESVPREVWLPDLQLDLAVLQEALDGAEQSTRLRRAQRGRPRRLAQLAQENAETALEARLAHRAGRPAHHHPGVYDLQRALDLEQPPNRAVCLDVSNLGATDAVASVVVSENGQPRRSDYRRMRMRGVGPDDFAMMKEAVRRYFTRVARAEHPRPDLVIVDGGVGQVRAAQEALEELGLGGMALIGIAKKEERIVFADGKELTLPRRSRGLRSVMRLRDEAHRFAVSYHRKLRGRRTIGSVLDGIPGIGPTRRRELLSMFGSVEALRGASVNEIVSRTRIPRTVAERLLASLHGVSGEH